MIIVGGSCDNVVDILRYSTVQRSSITSTMMLSTRQCTAITAARHQPELSVRHQRQVIPNTSLFSFNYWCLRWWHNFYWYIRTYV